MKLTDVPEDFRSNYTPSVDQIKAMKIGFIVPTNDCNGHSMPHIALNIKGLYEGDIVKLKHPTSGDEFIVRRTEVMTKSAQEVVHEWQTEVFRKEIDQIRYTANMKEAAMILNLPPGGAVAMKLNKAWKLGIPVPAWFRIA